MAFSSKMTGVNIDTILMAVVGVIILTALLPTVFTNLLSLGDIFNGTVLAPLFADGLIWYIIGGIAVYRFGVKTLGSIGK